jgi:hypothetical protein
MAAIYTLPCLVRAIPRKLGLIAHIRITFELPADEVDKLQKRILVACEALNTAPTLKAVKPVLR